MPQISVIVPVYKVEKYLHRCVDSILNQSYRDFEIILVNDGSPDNCPRLCDEYANRYSNVKVIHKQNGGQGEARNKGIDYVITQGKSKYITFVDSDDWLHPQYLESLYSSLLSQHTKISCCSFIRTNEHNTTNNNLIERVNIIHESAEKLWCEKKINIAVPWGKLFDVNLFVDKRFPVGVVYEDMRTIPKVLFPLNKITFINVPLYYYFHREDSTMNSGVTEKKLNDSYDCFTEMMDYFYDNHFFDAAKRWFTVFFTWSFIECPKDFAGYRRYIKKLKSFMKKYANDFPFEEYPKEYSKLYSKNMINILAKIQRLSTNM